MSDSNDPMAEIRASFFIECEELLEALQDGLQELYDGADDTETINVVFRAVHSIKGGAGAFGLEHLVHFAHRFETVLDEIRAGRMTADADALKIFFQCADHLSDLVRASRDASDLPHEKTTRLLTDLDEMLGEDAATADAETEEEIDFQPAVLSLDLGLGDGGEGIDDALQLTDIPDLPPALELNRFRITFSPENELFETGNEPFHMLRALDYMGECEVICLTEKIPDFEELVPEQSYLSWQIDMATEADKAEIEAAFEFVEGLCKLNIETLNPVTETEVISPDALPGPDNGQENSPSGGSPLPESSPDKVNPAAIKSQDDMSTQSKAAITSATENRNQTKASPTSGKPSATPVATKSVVRVDLDRIERLVNLVGELVINQAMLSQSLESSELSPHSDAMNGLEEFQRLTRDIQDSVMMIRAQPVKSLFQRMSRIVRESSASVEKDVRLRTNGENTEVDKTVIERLADPLTHMIRNAVDHGLESPQERIAAGKPAQGQVNLTAAHRSGRVVIDVSDDGGGINREKVLQIAIDKGLVPGDVSLSDTEIDNLLFLPGFSTASVVSDLSGRGVGMDVVRTAIQSLGGRITISSTPGSGTTFSISLPLTLAVLDGMVVQVADETIVLPLNVVVETLTLSKEDVQMVRPGSNVVQVRSDFVPIFDLGSELGYREPVKDYEGSVVLLIAHEDGSHAALAIDSIVDQRQVVIKGLDDSFYRAPGIAAATILGDGQIALILDTSDIISNAIGFSGMGAASSTTGLSA